MVKKNLIYALSALLFLSSCEFGATSESVKESSSIIESSSIKESSEVIESSSEDSSEVIESSSNVESSEPSVESSDISEESSSISESSSEAEPEYATIHVNYYYEDGTFINCVENLFEVGKKYSIFSPNISFMTPDQDKISGVVEEDDTFNVYYSYSKEATTLETGKKYDNFMVDSEKGISFTFVISGATNENENIFSGTTFAIQAGKYHLNDVTNSYSGDFYASGAESFSKANWHSLMTRSDHEMVASISINPKLGNVSFYVDGELALIYTGSMYASNYKYKLASDKQTKVFRDFVAASMKDLKENGFTFASGTTNYELKDFIMDYALTSEQAKEYSKAYRHVRVDYYDNNVGKIIAEPNQKLFKEDAKFLIKSPRIDHFTAQEASVSGTCTQDEVYQVIYNFNGHDKIGKTAAILDKTNKAEWYNTDTWYYVAKNRTGDFMVYSEYHMYGVKGITPITDGIGNSGSNIGDGVWRTYLNAIADSVTKDCYLLRLDPVSWLNDWSGDGACDAGTSAYTYNWWGSLSYDYDLMPIFQDCITKTYYYRIGNTIYIDTTLYPQASDYEGMSFNFVYEVYDVKATSIDVAITAEYAYTEILKVQYE